MGMHTYSVWHPGVVWERFFWNKVPARVAFKGSQELSGVI